MLFSVEPTEVDILFIKPKNDLEHEQTTVINCNHTI